MSRAGFRRVGPDVDFPSLEERVLGFWDEADAFGHSVRFRPPESEYTFYDGPPFPTGTPHYGNLLAGVIKDVVPRYWTMRGHRVVRRFGWDTHGLPIEMEVQQALGLSGPAAIEEYGIARFNEACRERVQANTEAWERITRRIGRWVDFEDDYKTMDLSFMESVWWVFKRLWEAGLIYEDFKVLPYSYGASTPLSNFEANLDYREIDDPAITVRLTVTGGQGPAERGDYLLIWTTTPWTLPGNLAVAVGDDISYARVLAPFHGEAGHYWVAANLVERFWPEGAHVVGEAPGRDLIGAAYRPPFPYFEQERANGAFRVIASDDVNTEEGTGLVHMAPAYGEADFLALQEAALDVLVDPVDAEARFTNKVPEAAGLNVKDADSILIDLLKQEGLLVRHDRVRHSYPFCWRTGTPLIYKAIPTWFVRVEQIRDRMAELNEQVHWVPEHVGSRRFGNWLVDARDWAISRNRYWGSCIPVWQCESCRAQECIGSLDELEERSGVRLIDLHRHYVDPVTFPCRECGDPMRRVAEVLDVWFESGSMPVAENHYPFENEARFARRFPADFIAEGLDQTRGWFYTLMVLGTALFDQVAFRNCVVNGLILAEDGRKMSKSLKNYPDPLDVIASTGADALRAYLINSPVVRAEPLRFSEEGVRDVVRTVMLPYWNAYSFFTTYSEADGIDRADLEAAPPPSRRPEIDRWILSVLQSLIRTVDEQMEGYYLYAVIPPLVDFIDDLTNWYIRRSRRRFWRRRAQSAGDDDKLAAFATLYEVLVTFSQVMAPVLPFITEELYRSLVVDQRRPGEDGPASIHHCDYPAAEQELIDADLEQAMATVRTVVGLGRSLRVNHGLKVRRPLRELTVMTRDPAIGAAVESHADLIADELNVKRVVVTGDDEALVHLTAKANFRVLGPRLGERVKEVAEAIESLDAARIGTLLDTGRLGVAGFDLEANDVVVTRRPRPGLVVATESDLAVALDTELTPALVREGIAREVVNRIQALRRRTGLDVADRIVVGWRTGSATVAEAIAEHAGFIAAEVLAVDLAETATAADAVDVEGKELLLEIRKAPT